MEAGFDSPVENPETCERRPVDNELRVRRHIVLRSAIAAPSATRASSRRPLPPAAVDELDAVAVRVLDEAEAGAAFADAVGLALGSMPCSSSSRERRVEVVDADRDVAVARAEVVRAAVVLNVSSSTVSWSPMPKK